MNINFSQSTGIITLEDGSILVPEGQAWAGKGPGKLNPAMESIHDTGPLPRGVYSVGAWGMHEQLGPNSAPLTQISGVTFGRSGFYCHGPASAESGEYGQESKGCIVVCHEYRLKIIQLAPNTITVIE